MSRFKRKSGVFLFNIILTLPNPLCFVVLFCRDDLPKNIGETQTNIAKCVLPVDVRRSKTP